MGLELIWNGPELSTALQQASMTGLRYGGIHLHNKAREQIGKPVVKVRTKRTRDTSRGKKGSSYMKVIVRSKIGEPPRLDSAFGRDNCVYEESEADQAVRVGIRQNAMYMFGHEVGGRNWLRRTLTEQMKQLTALVQVGAVSAAKDKGIT